MRTICIFLMLLASAAAVACVSMPQETDPWKDWGAAEPEYNILIFPLGPIQVLCGGPVPGFSIFGCTYVGTDPCQIFMASPVQLGEEQYQAVLRHEKAHCRGWEHGEPQPEGTV